MDLTKLTLFETLRERMAFLSARQTVLAENVANANTPKFRAKDVEAPDFAAMAEGEMVRPAMLSITSSKHIAAATDATAAFRVRDMPDAESTPNGNSVVLEDQMMKVASVQMDYSAATQIYKKALSLIRLAVAAPR